MSLVVNGSFTIESLGAVGSKPTLEDMLDKVKARIDSALIEKPEKLVVALFDIANDAIAHRTINYYTSDHTRSRYGLSRSIIELHTNNVSVKIRIFFDDQRYDIVTTKSYRWGSI